MSYSLSRSTRVSRIAGGIALMLLAGLAAAPW